MSCDHSWFNTGLWFGETCPEQRLCTKCFESQVTTRNCRWEVQEESIKNRMLKLYVKAMKEERLKQLKEMK